MARYCTMKLLTLMTLFSAYLVVWGNNTEVRAGQSFSSGHTNNWAVLVSTSRFWYNYRHAANTLSVYRTVKRLGIPDSHIILMLTDDMACNHRNPRPATVFSDRNAGLNEYGDDVEVDYRGFEVTVENLLRVLTGRTPPSTPRSKRLLSDGHSNVLVYLTGHGGDGFMQFQDSEMSNLELADAFQQMWQKRRYNELLLIVDTCQAASMYEKLYSPNVMALTSSLVGESSLAHQSDLEIGVSLMDRYTFHLLRFLEGIHPASNASMNDLFKVCPKSQCVSTPSHRTDLFFLRDPGSVLVTDFFGAVLRKVELTVESVDLTDLKERPMEEEPVRGDSPRDGRSYVDQLPVSEIVRREPKQKDWRPPDGFVLGLWSLVLLVFLATYGVERLKRIFLKTEQATLIRPMNQETRICSSYSKERQSEE